LLRLLTTWMDYGLIMVGNTPSQDPIFGVWLQKWPVEWASGGTAYIRWGYGRTECSETCPLWANRHPDASQGFYAMQEHMINRLGFNWQEAIGLIGAHCLGETHIENSGYHGRWVPTPANYFSNSFFQNLLRYDWFSVVVPPYQGNNDYGTEATYNAGSYSNNYGKNEKVEYVTNELAGGVMLPSDGAIAYRNLNLSCTLTHNSNCPLYRNHCPYAYNVLGIVQNYANNNQAWVSDFVEAFQKLQEFGGDQIYYNPQADTQYDLYQTKWTGYNGWYTDPNDYGILYNN